MIAWCCSAWAQAAPVDPLPDIPIRLLVGALGGVASVATLFLATSGVPRPEGTALWYEVAARVALGAGAGFAASALPLEVSAAAWLGWVFVAGFSGSGFLGVLSTVLAAGAELKKANELRSEVRQVEAELRQADSTRGPEPPTPPTGGLRSPAGRAADRLRGALER